jgi:PAS domain S-box-containing protein
MDYPKTVSDIITQQEKPAIWANEKSIIEGINPKFTETYGWTEADLLGKPLTQIMPSQFRELHNIGFSRFLTTEQSKIAGKPLSLAILFKDGTEKNAEHFILAEKKDGNWRFAATITLRQ